MPAPIRINSPLGTSIRLTSFQDSFADNQLLIWNVLNEITNLKNISGKGRVRKFRTCHYTDRPSLYEALFA